MYTAQEGFLVHNLKRKEELKRIVLERWRLRDIGKVVSHEVRCYYPIVPRLGRFKISQQRDGTIQLGQFIFADRVEACVPKRRRDRVLFETVVQAERRERADAAAQTFLFANVPGDEEWKFVVGELGRRMIELSMQM